MIALIEDNSSIAQFIVAALEMHGYHVRHFSDGDSFLATLPDYTYDIILTDFMLPGHMPGLQIIMHLQENWPMLPIIVISAASENLLVNLRIHYPTIPVIRKPFRIQQLLQKLAEVEHIERLALATSVCNI